ncbi:HAMP domain-containing sensor histidine kinase [Microbacter sp. GSS18]|nr:HAMP domain-containing sensor histidine kinase [Microbacter sp. GSS18]
MALLTREDPGGRADERAARVRAARAAWLREDIEDRTRGRAATLNQLLLMTVVFVLGVFVVLGPFTGDVVAFFAGVVAIFAITGATFVIPWGRIAFGWVAIVPVLDGLSILLIVESGGSPELGLLWIFPTIWLSTGFGLLGVYGLITSIAVLAPLMAFTRDQSASYATILIPVVLVALAITSHLTARRYDAQQVLLGKQGELLRTVLERTRRQEQEVTEVLDAVDFGVIRIAADGGVSVSNDAHARLQRAVATSPEDDPPAFRDDGVTPLPRRELPFERARRGEAFSSQIVWFGDADGPRQALSVTARRLADTEGRDAGAVVISRDVTAELNALRARDELVASVSHELRTPLTSILGFLDLAIEDDGVPDGVRSNLEVAGRNAERLLGIVGDILAASSSSSAAVESSLEPRELDAAETVRASAEALGPRAAERAVTIDLEGLETAMVWADPLRLRQVVDNLLSNGIAYNRDGGTVYLGTTTDGEHSWILVRDTGRGVTEADRARLFQRYFRAGTDRPGGTGLGLAITRDIVRAHGGEIALRSTVGVGSTFIVKLPVRDRSTAHEERTTG